MNMRECIVSTHNAIIQSFRMSNWNWRKNWFVDFRCCCCCDGWRWDCVVFSALTLTLARTPEHITLTSPAMFSAFHIAFLCACAPPRQSESIFRTRNSGEAKHVLRWQRLSVCVCVRSLAAVGECVCVVRRRRLTSVVWVLKSRSIYTMSQTCDDIHTTVSASWALSRAGSHRRCARNEKMRSEFLEVK